MLNATQVRGNLRATETEREREREREKCHEGILFIQPRGEEERTSHREHTETNKYLDDLAPSQ